MRQHDRGRVGVAAKRGAFTLLELIVVLAIIAVVMGLLLPAVQKVRGVALKAACANNLHQIGLALHQYHGTHGHFPPGVSTDTPLYSWHVELLPYLEQEALAADARRSVAFNIPHEGPYPGGPHQGVGTVVPVFGCPADGQTRVTHDFGGLHFAVTSYLGIQGVNRARLDGVLYADSRVRVGDITDGTSNTLAVGERPPYIADHQGSWGMWYTGLYGIAFRASFGTGAVVLGVREPCASPHFLDSPCGTEVFRFGPGAIGDPHAAYHFWSVHSGGGHFLFADGSVHFLTYGVEPLMPALASRAGGEEVSLP
jgi:prepilin-type N-terminal cleavage/methylation domain-containing protein/prepilin-type processing-associated H-X9-DG protein